MNIWLVAFERPKKDNLRNKVSNFYTLPYRGLNSFTNFCPFLYFPICFLKDKNCITLYYCQPFWPGNPKLQQLSFFESTDWGTPYTSLNYPENVLLCFSNSGFYTKLYDKHDDFDFHIVNFPFLSSNIPSSPYILFTFPS